MEWIQTAAGRKFYPLHPRVEDIDIEDIAHALSLNCRFNGHCRTFYSVAEHSVRESRLLEGDEAMWGLLHDASEAYLTDLPRPVKVQMPAFRDWEDKLEKIIIEHFGLTWPMPEAVKVADDRLLSTEARDLMAEPPDVWSWTAEVLAERIEPWSWEEAKRTYLTRFAELRG